MREAKDILASKVTIDNEFGLESSLPHILEAMEEYRADLKQSRDTWEDIAQNCRKDLEVQVEAIVELREANKLLSKRFDEVFNAFKNLYEETEKLKEHCIEQRFIDWEDESIDGCKHLDKALKTAQDYIFNRA